MMGKTMLVGRTSRVLARPPVGPRRVLDRRCVRRPEHYVVVGIAPPEPAGCRMFTAMRSAKMQSFGVAARRVCEGGASYPA